MASRLTNRRSWILPARVSHVRVRSPFRNAVRLALRSWRSAPTRPATPPPRHCTDLESVPPRPREPIRPRAPASPPLGSARRSGPDPSHVRTALRACAGCATGSTRACRARGSGSPRPAARTGHESPGRCCSPARRRSPAPTVCDLRALAGRSRRGSSRSRPTSRLPSSSFVAFTESFFVGMAMAFALLLATAPSEAQDTTPVDVIQG